LRSFSHRELRFLELGDQQLDGSLVQLAERAPCSGAGEQCFGTFYEPHVLFGGAELHSVLLGRRDGRQRAPRRRGGAVVIRVG
jgi:hypothetical protein